MNSPIVHQTEYVDGTNGAFQHGFNVKRNSKYRILGGTKFQSQLTKSTYFSFQRAQGFAFPF